MTTLVIYKAKDGWRWRIMRSGRIIAESGEAYTRKPQRAKLIARLQSALTDAFWGDGL